MELRYSFYIIFQNNGCISGSQADLNSSSMHLGSRRHWVVIIPKFRTEFAAAVWDLANNSEMIQIGCERVGMPGTLIKHLLSYKIAQQIAV